MMKGKVLLVNLLLIHHVISRGPHHPRGESVVKHHVHYKPTKGREQNIIQDRELIHDKEHMQDHLEDVIDQPNLDNLTEEELDFYYFQVHDADKNNLLDGLEILQAIQHTADHSDENEIIENDIDYYTELIDKVFDEDDSNNDGFLSYPEYKSGRDKETVKLAAVATRTG